MREKREMRRIKDVYTLSESLAFSSLSCKCISFYRHLYYSLQLSFNVILSVLFKGCSLSWTPRIMLCSLAFPLCYPINSSLLMLFTSFFRGSHMEPLVINMQQDLSGFGIDLSQWIDVNWAFLRRAISIPTTMRITIALWVIQTYGLGYWKFEISIFYINLLRTLQWKALTAISHITAIDKHRKIEGEINQPSPSLLQSCCIWAHGVHHLSVIFESTFSTLMLQRLNH